jgi:prevent-host-death family protein
MKTIGIRELQKRLKEVVETSQKEGVVVTRNGKPASLVIGVEGSDWEDVAYQTSPRFWKLIEERRNQETVSLSEMKERVFGKKRNKVSSKYY